MGLFGGGNSSSSNQTTNNDNRQVNTSTTSSYDLSNHSVDNSVNTSNVTDGGAIKAMGDLATLVTNNALQATQSGYAYSDHIFDSATSFANAAGARAADAFTVASKMETDSLTTARQAYEDAAKAQATAYGNASQAQAVAQQVTAAAYADAKGTTDSQKQIILGVLAVAGLMAFAMMQKKAG